VNERLLGYNLGVCMIALKY